jgi:hypothetical protein
MVTTCFSCTCIKNSRNKLYAYRTRNGLFVFAVVVHAAAPATPSFAVKATILHLTATIIKQQRLCLPWGFRCEWEDAALGSATPEWRWRLIGFLTFNCRLHNIARLYYYLWYHQGINSVPSSSCLTLSLPKSQLCDS